NAACINRHQNACSAEHLFERKGQGQYKRITRGILVAALVSAATACLPDPQRVQSVSLLEQLVAARTTLAEQSPRAADQACTTVGDVHTRLTGQPRLVELRPAWPALRDATQAPQADCGQTTMLGQ